MATEPRVPKTIEQAVADATPPAPVSLIASAEAARLAAEFERAKMMVDPRPDALSRIEAADVPQEAAPMIVDPKGIWVIHTGKFRMHDPESNTTYLPQVPMRVAKTDWQLLQHGVLRLMPEDYMR